MLLLELQRLQRLSEDILDITRIESQLLCLKEERFNLNDVITNAINDAKANNDFLKKEKNGIIKLEYQPHQDVFVQADKGRITQVVSNLLSNAIKFTQEGTISISLERKEYDDNNDHVVISVKDSGQSINPEILSKLLSWLQNQKQVLDWDYSYPKVL